MSTLKAIDSLVEIRLWDLEVSTVSDGLDGEDEGLSSEHSELTHHLPWMGHKQADGFLLVNHPLVDMQTARQDKVQTYILKRWKEEEIEITEREKDTNNFAVLPDRFFFVVIQLLYLLYFITILATITTDLQRLNTELDRVKIEVRPEPDFLTFVLLYKKCIQ